MNVSVEVSRWLVLTKYWWKTVFTHMFLPKGFVIFWVKEKPYFKIQSSLTLLKLAIFFKLRPFKIIFKTFSNPANDKYGWVGADNFEVILLNYFPWSSWLVKWKEFFLLLKGHTVHLQALENYFASDIYIDKDTLVFTTSKNVIKLFWQR